MRAVGGTSESGAMYLLKGRACRLPISGNKGSERMETGGVFSLATDSAERHGVEQLKQNRGRCISLWEPAVRRSFLTEASLACVLFCSLMGALPNPSTWNIMEPNKQFFEQKMVCWAPVFRLHVD